MILIHTGGGRVLSTLDDPRRALDVQPLVFWLLATRWRLLCLWRRGRGDS